MTRIHPDAIGFDFDGVIADIGEAFLRLACRDHGYCSYSVDDITSFQVEECIDIPLPVVGKIFQDILDDSLATGLLPIQGALEGIEQLSQKATVTIITARQDDKPVRRWLDHYLPQEITQKITLFAMGDHDKKVEYLENLNLTYFVDDRAKTCEQVKSSGRVPLLFHQPWNSTFSECTVVRNWKELLALVL